MALGLSLREVGEALSVNFTGLYEIERDNRVPSVDLLCRIARVLDLDADELRGLAGKLSTEEVGYLKANPKVVKLLGAMMKAKVGAMETERLIEQVKEKKKR
jgi:transcriptional regulator with XRE-family HTH domain